MCAKTNSAKSNTKLIIQMNWKTIKEEFEAQKIRQTQLASAETRGTPAGRTNIRKGGGVMVLLGLVFGGANYFTWSFWGTIYKLLLALSLGLLGLGIYALLTGKMPGKK